jgi:hypothetical protein
MHTPGPWEICDPSEGREMAQSIPIRHKWLGGQYTVCRVGNNYRSAPLNVDRQRTIDADARLIADAPALLAMLRKITDEYASLMDSGDCGPCQAHEVAEINEARALLARHPA